MRPKTREADKAINSSVVNPAATRVGPARHKKRRASGKPPSFRRSLPYARRKIIYAIRLHMRFQPFESLAIAFPRISLTFILYDPRSLIACVF